MTELPRSDFKRSQVKDLLLHKNVSEAQAYIKQYFYKLRDPVCIYFWDALANNFVMYRSAEIKELYLTSTLTYDIPTEDKVISRKFSDWYFKEDEDIYYVTMNVEKGKIFEHQGRKYINIFHGFRYGKGTRKPITDDHKKGIALVWQHVKEVLCSNNINSFKYVKNWLCRVIAGKKLKTALVLRSQEGTGKGILTSFIYEKVIGLNVLCMSTSTKCLSGGFNGELEGKTLLVLEEISTSTTSEVKKVRVT